MTEEQNPYSAPPQTSPQPISPNEERQWGMFGHLAPLVAMVFSAGVLGFVGSLIIYVMYKDRGPFVRAHAANSLNVQLNALAWFVGIMVFGIFTLGLLWIFFWVPFVWAAVLHIIGAIKANGGEWWTPPLVIKFVS
jgi:uncharacterized protein